MWLFTVCGSLWLAVAELCQLLWGPTNYGFAMSPPNNVVVFLKLECSHLSLTVLGEPAKALNRNMYDATATKGLRCEHESRAVLMEWDMRPDAGGVLLGQKGCICCF